MTREKGKNTAASIRTRLLALAQSKGEDYQRVLGRYAIERFLYRLGRSPHRDKFALKGANLFTLWTGQTHRPTKDLDLLGRGSSAIGEVEETIRAICGIQEKDGIVFDNKSVEGTKIKEEDEYDGVRVKFRAELAGARIPMQIDIGFGDAIYPEPELASFPVLLPMEAPVIRAYPREASIAEKFHAMVVLDIRNSRMKDFYDIWFMANTWTFDRAYLRRAILASFERRGTAIPMELPFALTSEFLNDPQKNQQWAAFVSRLNPGDKAPSLEEVGAILRTFLLPCISGRTPTEGGIRSWTPDRHWNTTEADTSSKPQE
ncbi:MAG TPA: nucleotidyl transferase AbiEii/AbiGii toxin family protein [Candidatus Dormibacteraeota bacterium]|nr:nucleotidyl transferase AbiEii/AbiGii toxin family protein [Candidatus Dormibacteraeota bacterium]